MSPKACKHTRASYKGEVDVPNRRLVYVCCDCGARVAHDAS